MTINLLEKPFTINLSYSTNFFNNNPAITMLNFHLFSFFRYHFYEQKAKYRIHDFSYGGEAKALFPLIFFRGNDCCLELVQQQQQFFRPRTDTKYVLGLGR
jgi:hypothetical protein